MSDQITLFNQTPVPDQQQIVFADLLRSRQASVYCLHKKLVHHDLQLGIHVFMEPSPKDRHPDAVTMAGFHGKQLKPNFHYRFINEDCALQYRQKWEANIRENTRIKQERRAKAKAALTNGHQVAVGDVLMASWGFEQTNIDYYQVTRLIGQQSVELCKIASHRDEHLPMQGDCVPVKNRFTGQPFTRRIASDGQSVRINSVCHASRIEPVHINGMDVFKPVSWSSYA